MLRFLLVMMWVLVGWRQDTPREVISLENVERIEQLQVINHYLPEKNISSEIARQKWAVAIDPDGTTLAFGGADGLLRVWNIETNAIEFLEEAATYYIEELVFSTDGTTLFVLGSEHELTRWSTLDWTLQPSEEVTSYGVAVSPDGSLLAVTDRSRIVLYDSASLAELRNMPPEVTIFDPDIVDLAISPDGEHIVSIGGQFIDTDSYLQNPVLTLWDIYTGELLNQVNAVEGFWSVAYSPDGSLIATGDEVGDIMLWDAQTLTLIATLPTRFRLDRVRDLVFSADSDLLISSTTDGTIRLWDVATYTEIGTLEGHTEGVSDFALSADGTLLASASWDGTVRLWGVR